MILFKIKLLQIESHILKIYYKITLLKNYFKIIQPVFNYHKNIFFVKMRMIILLIVLQVIYYVYKIIPQVQLLKFVYRMDN